MQGVGGAGAFGSGCRFCTAEEGVCVEHQREEPGQASRASQDLGFCPQAGNLRRCQGQACCSIAPVCSGVKGKTDPGERGEEESH